MSMRACGFRSGQLLSMALDMSLQPMSSNEKVENRVCQNTATLLDIR